MKQNKLRTLLRCCGYFMFLMVSSSCKHLVNGCKIEVIETTTECTTGCVAFFIGGVGGGEVGFPELPP